MRLSYNAAAVAALLLGLLTDNADAHVTASPDQAPADEVAWRGGPLPDAHFDEFGLSTRLPAEQGTLYFPDHTGV